MTDPAQAPKKPKDGGGGTTTGTGICSEPEAPAKPSTSEPTQAR